MLFCLCGFHATVAYSSLGLINMLYAVSLTLGVAGRRVRFRRPSVLAHCNVVVCMRCREYDVINANRKGQTLRVRRRSDQGFLMRSTLAFVGNHACSCI